MLLKDLLSVVCAKEISIFAQIGITDNLEEMFDIFYAGPPKEVPDDLLQLPVRKITARGKKWFEVKVSDHV